MDAAPQRPRIFVCTTLAAYVCDDVDTSEAWLYNALGLAADADALGYSVEYFVAIETDGRGMEPFSHLLGSMGLTMARAHENERLQDFRINFFTYTLDDGRTEVTTANRLRHLTMGQNICSEYAYNEGAAFMLFLAADLEPDPATFSKLIGLNHPITGGHVSTYGLDGPIVPKFIPQHGKLIRSHMATAAYVLLRRDALRVLRWRVDGEMGMTDDPCLHHDAREYHGWETYVHHGCIGKHHPECIPRIEDRGHDMRVVR